MEDTKILKPHGLVKENRLISTYNSLYSKTQPFYCSRIIEITSRVIKSDGLLQEFCLLVIMPCISQQEFLEVRSLSGFFEPPGTAVSL